MCKRLIDAEAILLDNEEWCRLEEKWGTPIDLETEDTDDNEPRIKPVISSWDLGKSTFDSSFLFKKVRRKTKRNPSNADASLLAYKDFIEDLEKESLNTAPTTQFYLINGQMLSALSVEEICKKIDEIFRSIEKLCSATSTIKKKSLPKVSKVTNQIPETPKVVQCSISTTDLSFDDTLTPTGTSSEDDTVNRCIDEAFEELNSTITNITRDDDQQSSKESVTTLVKKFSSILQSPAMKCNPRRQRQCCEKFKDLAEFWKNRAFVDK